MTPEVGRPFHGHGVDLVPRSDEDVVGLHVAADDVVRVEVFHPVGSPCTVVDG